MYSTLKKIFRYNFSLILVFLNLFSQNTERILNEPVEVQQKRLENQAVEI